MSGLSVGKLYKGNFNEIQEFESYLKEETKLAFSSIKKYVQDLERFKEFVVKTDGDMNNLTRIDVQSYINDMVERKLSATTINRNFRAIKRFTDYQGNYNCTKDLRIPEKPSLDDMEIKSYDEKTLKSILRLVEQSKNLKEIAIFNTLYYTGCRAEELVNMDIERFDFKRNGMLRLLGKGNKERIIPLSNELKIHLRNYLEERGNPTTGPLFPSRQSERMSTKTVERVMKKYDALYNLNKKEEDKVKIHAHAFRHTFCSRLVQKIDIVRVSKIMGHKSLDVTRRYAMSSVEGAIEAIDSL